MENMLLDLYSLEKSIEETYKVRLALSGNKNSFTIHVIIINPVDRSKGLGSQIMNTLIAYADANYLNVYLSPSISFGASSINRLKKFYKRFGFVENAGRNKDYSITHSMLRTQK